ncbi:helix-turn-helix domain-containing protein [Streptomyces sp. NPDC090112]|uniref:helix-turn-helix domain-containing protein n=1 Tax=Streptomyces sp. NPDC090112 TaxID=3365949 RepID=UPI00381BB6C4
MGRKTGDTVSEAGDFARLMRELKERGGLSYGALARRLHTSTSTLHRYCNGEALPAEFAVVDRFARACGASAAEAVDLHRAWLLADARRRAGTTALRPDRPADADREMEAGADPGPEPAPAGGAGPDRGPEPEPEPVVAVGVAVSGEGTAGPAGRGRYRRRAVVAAAAGVAAGAVAAALLAVAGPGTGGPGTGAGPDAPGPAAAASGAATPGVPSGTGAAPTVPQGAAATPSGPDGGPSTASGPSSGAASGTESGPDAPGPAVRTPLKAAVRSHVWAAGCDHAYLSERAPGSVPAPPVEADAPAWAAAQRAVHAGSQTVEVTLHGTGEGAVVLEDLEVRVTARRTPPAWNVFQMSQGCGGGLTPAAFAVNLDAPRPLARPVPGNDAGNRLPAPAFPLRVSAADPVVLRVDAATTGCDCDWFLELRWSAPSGSGTLRIDDAGRPLRTSAAAGRPVYGYALEQGRWSR